MASTVVDPTAVLIAAVITNLTTTQSVKAYAQDPGPAGLDTLPAGLVGLPSIERTRVEQPESQLNATDWLITYPVEFFFDITDAEFTATQAVETIEAFIKAIDADPSLGSQVMDTKVITADPAEVLDAARPMLMYGTRVQVLKLVDDQ